MSFSLSYEELDTLTARFTRAVEQNLISKVLSYLNLGVDPNLLIAGHKTALHVVAEHGFNCILDALLNHPKIIIDKRNDLGKTPLNLACLYNHYTTVQMLLEKGAGVNIPDKNGYAPLHNTILYKQFDLVELLIKHKADVNMENAFGNTPLYLSTVEVPSLPITQLLITAGADINRISKKVMPLLLECSLVCHTPDILEMIELLLHNGANVNIRDTNTKQTALHIVGITGYLPLAILLYNYGADIEVRDSKKYKPYDIAVKHDNFEVAYFLSESK